MTSYARRSIFTEEHVTDFAVATRLANVAFARRPYREVDRAPLRCHELSRAIAPFLSLAWEVRDGHLGSVEHSWLQHGSVILDTYAPGSLPEVQLVDLGCGRLVGARAYEAGPIREDARGAVVADLIGCFGAVAERQRDRIVGRGA